MNVADSAFAELLKSNKKMVVYGLSPDVSKASHYVPVYMREQGWEIVGIYPKPHDVSEFTIYNSLKDVPLESRRFVNVFRSSDKILQVVEEAIAVGGVEVLWFQLGISNVEAELLAENTGIKVVSDRCLIIEHKKWFN